MFAGAVTRLTKKPPQFVAKPCPPAMAVCEAIIREMASSTSFFCSNNCFAECLAPGSLPLPSMAISRISWKTLAEMPSLIAMTWFFSLMAPSSQAQPVTPPQPRRAWPGQGPGRLRVSPRSSQRFSNKLSDTRLRARARLKGAGDARLGEWRRGCSDGRRIGRGAT